MRISDWSSDVCSSDLHAIGGGVLGGAEHQRQQRDFVADRRDGQRGQDQPTPALPEGDRHLSGGPSIISSMAPGLLRPGVPIARGACRHWPPPGTRSEEHTSELQSLMRISYAVFCLKKKKKRQLQRINQHIACRKSLT